MNDAAEVLSAAMRAGEMTIRLLELGTFAGSRVAALIHALFARFARGTQIPVSELAHEQIAPPLLIRACELRAFRKTAARLALPFAAVRADTHSERILLFAKRDEERAAHVFSLCGSAPRPLRTPEEDIFRRPDAGLLDGRMEGSTLCTFTVPARNAGRFMECAAGMDLVCEGAPEGEDVLIVLPEAERALAADAWTDAGLPGAPDFTCAARMIRFRESLASRLSQCEAQREDAPLREDRNAFHEGSTGASHPRAETPRTEHSALDGLVAAGARFAVPDAGGCGRSFSDRTDPERML